MHYVERKFSICMDFPERQEMDTWRGMVHALCYFPFVWIFQRDRGWIHGEVWCMHALCCKEIFHLYGFSRETGDGYVERYVTLLHALCYKEIFHLYGFSRETGEWYMERCVACTGWL